MWMQHSVDINGQVFESPTTTENLAAKANPMHAAASASYNTRSAGATEDMNEGRASARENTSDQQGVVDRGMDRDIPTAMTERAFTPREVSTTVITKAANDRLRDAYPEAYDGSTTLVDFYNENPGKFEAVTYRDWTGDLAVEGSTKAEALNAAQNTGSSPNPSSGSGVRASGADNGFSAGVNPITIATAGKIRDPPVSNEYMNSLQGALQSLGPNIGAVITSGGQHPLGTSTDRTGSTRHDIICLFLRQSLKFSEIAMAP